MSTGTFRALLQQIMGPFGFWIQETRVQERVTVLNWGAVNPTNNQAVLFGIVCVEFGSEIDIHDLARDQLMRQRRGTAE